MVTRHLQGGPHPGVTAKGIERVLDNWLIRGDCIDSRGSRTMTHWGVPPGSKTLLRVAVSLDDERIVTAYPDRAATITWRSGNIGWFTERCKDLEVRDESQL